MCRLALSSPDLHRQPPGQRHNAEGILITIVLSKNNGFFFCRIHTSQNVNEHKLISRLTAALSVVVECWMCFSDQKHIAI